MSWTGSEKQRRKQGICLPPALPPDLRHRFTIPSETTVLIQPIDDYAAPWKEYKTRIDLGFDRCEGSQDGMGTFREQGFFIRAKWRDVIRLSQR